MEKKRLSEKGKLKRIIKEQQKVIRILTDKEIVKGLKSALEDFKKGKYTILTN